MKDKQNEQNGKPEISDQLESKRRSRAKYDAANTRHFGLKLNVKTEADILEMLDKQERYGTYIKKLIRKDIADQKAKEQ